MQVCRDDLNDLRQVGLLVVESDQVLLTRAGTAYLKVSEVETHGKHDERSERGEEPVKARH